MKLDYHERGVNALRQAERASKRGDLAGAQRWAKIAAQEAELWERFLAAPPVLAPEEDEEEVREELRRRLERFVAFDHAVQEWEEEREAYIEAVKIAARTGALPPAPLRTHPAGPSGNPEPHMIHLLQGPEPNDGR